VILRNAHIVEPGVETVVPIAATGSFARIAGSVFLAMVERKVRWISQRATTLA